MADSMLPPKTRGSQKNPRLLTAALFPSQDETKKKEKGKKNKDIKKEETLVRDSQV